MSAFWTIRYRDSAKNELEAIIQKRPDLKELIIRRLHALEHFPPEKWLELRHQQGSDVFTSDSPLVRISGEADPKTRTVWVHKVTVGRK